MKMNNKNLNVPHLRVQSDACIGSAEREELRPQGNVPHLRFPEFAGEWIKKKMGQVVTLQRGCSPRPIVKYITNDDGVNWIKIGDMPTIGRVVSYTKEKITKEGAKKSRFVDVGDLILSNSMSFGQSYIMGIQGYIHDGWFVIRNYNKTFDRDFLCDVMIAPATQNQYKKVAAGGVVQNISSELVNNTEVSIPTLQEQKKIAKLFTLIDDRIATQSKIIEDLERLRSAIYHSVFSTIKGQTIALKSVANIVKGEQLNGTELSNNGDYYVMNGGIVPSGYYHKYNTPANTISISEGGNSCGYVQFNHTPFWSGGHCYTLHITHTKVDLQFLYHFLKYKEKDIMALRIGSGLPNVQKKDLENFSILLPAIDGQKKTAQIFDILLQKEKLEKSMINQLCTQKQYLLQQMFI